MSDKIIKKCNSWDDFTNASLKINLKNPMIFIMPLIKVIKIKVG